MRSALRLALAALPLLAAPVAGQTDLVPDPDDPRTAAEARRWLDATLEDLESGRKVVVPTPGGPLPYLVVDRSALSTARDLTVASGGSQRDALTWSAGVLRQQRDLRSRVLAARAGLLARAGGDRADPAAGRPSGTPVPRVAVVRGTPDADRRPAAAEDRGAADPTVTMGPSPLPVDAARESAPTDAGPGFADPGPGFADPGPGFADPGPDPATVAPDPAAAAPEPATTAGPGVPTASSPAPMVGGGGGGVRGGRSPSTGVWIVLGLGLVTVALGGALLVARRRPAPRPGPAVPAGPRVDLVLEITGAGGAGSTRFRSVPILIGRDPGCDLVLGDPRVSRRHARVAVEEGELWITDLDSIGGLEIDGRRVGRGPLRRATTVRLGDTTLTVR